MLQDGTYRAYFKTPLGQGTGIAHVANGQIWGCDSIMTYSGTCTVDGDHFSAILLAKRHTEGHATVFGVDDLRMTLEGTSTGKIAHYVAKAEQVPGMILEGTLILSEQEEPAAESAPMSTFDPSKLPKLPNRLR